MSPTRQSLRLSFSDELGLDGEISLNGVEWLPEEARVARSNWRRR